MSTISSLLVTHVEDPTGTSNSIFFWGVTAERSIREPVEKALFSLKPQLDKACFAPKNLSGLTSGQIFLALVNRRWERAKLVSSNVLNNENSKLKVFCIDVGGEYLVSLEEICLLSSLPSFPVALSETPALASRFIFADILPAHDKWAKTVIGFLKTHLEKHTWLVTALGSFNQCTGVRIYNEHNRETLFATIMIKLGLAKAAESYKTALTTEPSPKPVAKKPVRHVQFKDAESVKWTPLYNVVKIPQVELKNQEELLVVHVEMGFFFGQLMKRTGPTLEALISELTLVYENDPNPPRLYKNFDSRLGRYAVVKYSADGLFYRVYITRELPNGDVEVAFVDFGNTEIVARNEIFAPIAELKEFLQQPFGIRCSSPELSPSRPELSKSLIGKTIQVAIGPMIMDNIYTVYLVENEAKKYEVGTLLDPKDTPIMSLSNLSPLSTEFNPSCQTQYSPELSHLLSPPQTPSVSSVTHDFLLSPFDSLSLNAYPLQPLLNGATRMLEVVYVKDPGNFYCQLADDFDLLSEMMRKINKAYTNELMPSLVSPKVGTSCMAQYLEDGKWYRGKVIDVNETEVEILFVDFGNTQRGPLDSAKAIVDEFVQFPPLAYHCELYFNESKKITNWTAAENKLFDAVTLDKEKMQGIFEKIDGSKYPVSLKAFEDGEWVNINDLFIRLPSVQVKVASFWNVGKFYLLPKDQSPYVNTDHLAELDKIDNYYSSIPASELIMTNPHVGTACVTRFTDQRFYRSKITAINGNMASVLFVDNGKSKEIPLSQLRQIEPRFLDCPQLVWECHLKGVKPIEPFNPDHKSYLKACFGTDQVIDAVLYPANQEGSFPVDLAITDVGDASTFLLKLGVVKKDQSSTLEAAPVVNGEQSVSEFTASSTKPKGMIKRVQISFIEPSGCFWIQLADENKAVFEDVEAHLKALDIEFHPNYQLSSSPIVDQCYAILHPNSGKWMRGKIVSISNLDAQVLFIDYGDLRTVSCSSIRTLPPILKFINPLAVRSQFNPLVYQCDEASNISSALKKICRPRQLCTAIASNWGENFLHIDSFETDKEIDVINQLINSNLLIKKHK